MSERRYSEQEVTRILKRATELEGGAPALPPGEGVSLEELRDIAREVGIDPGSVARAAAELDRPESRGSGSAVSRVHREVRVVPRAGREGTAHLIRHVDQAVEAQGTVTEALDAVRWNGETGVREVQVAIHDSPDGTVISVEERYPKLPQLLHAFPGIWGAALGAAVAEALVGSSAGGALTGFLAIVLAGMVAGVLVGHGVWRLICARSAGRVRELADELAAVAEEEGGEGEGRFS